MRVPMLLTLLVPSTVSIQVPCLNQTYVNIYASTSASTFASTYARTYASTLAGTFESTYATIIPMLEPKLY